MSTIDKNSFAISWYISTCAPQDSLIILKESDTVILYMVYNEDKTSKMAVVEDKNTNMIISFGLTPTELLESKVNITHQQMLNIIAKEFGLTMLKI